MVDGQVRQCALDLVPYPANRDAEHTLAAGNEVDDLIVAGTPRYPEAA